MRAHTDPDTWVCVHTFDAALLWAVTHRVRVPIRRHINLWYPSKPRVLHFICSTFSCIPAWEWECGVVSYLNLSQRAAACCCYIIWFIVGAGGAFRPWAGWQHISAGSFVQNRRHFFHFPSKIQSFPANGVESVSHKDTLYCKYAVTVFTVLITYSCEQHTSTQHSLPLGCKETWRSLVFFPPLT